MHTMASYLKVCSFNLNYALSIHAIVPNTKRRVVCPGFTVNYVCIEAENTPIIEWRVFCRRSLPETLCMPDDQIVPESLDVFTGQQQSGHVCDGTFSTSANSTLGVGQTVSHLNITVPQAPTTTHLEITCGDGSSCYYLYVESRQD